ncbi:IGF-like family receptor 1 isoform X2 [Phyllostomus hastatus]|uniref:IGF-like family receptor 1 isoform X2 n=1 Tax=Phyllostomus hastatus TaxID=9423 RepID=UPI001E67E64D|nr:IGF-like family receptor 1 isoform X2 [Phyllostomus hastatus]
MRPQRLLLSAALFLAQTVPQEASQHCGRLEYWNPDNLCCGSCLQRFGPPPCPDYEFSENCGLNDFGDHVTHPFKKCPHGQCNPDNAELCSPCGSRARVPTPGATQRQHRRRCREKPAPTKEPCPLKPETPSVLSSQESSSLTVSSPPRTSEHTAPWQALLTIALPLVLVLLVTSAIILWLAQQRHSSHHHGKAVHPYSGIARGDPNISPGSLEAPEAELPNLTSQPLSRLLDELEVLEELIVLLDPEPGPVASYLLVEADGFLGSKWVWGTEKWELLPAPSIIQTGRPPLQTLTDFIVGGGVPTWDPTLLNKKVHRKEGI